MQYYYIQTLSSDLPCEAYWCSGTAQGVVRTNRSAHHSRVRFHSPPGQKESTTFSARRANDYKNMPILGIEPRIFSCRRNTSETLYH